MPDQYRRRRQAGGHGGHIAHIVVDGKTVEMLAPRRTAMAGKADGVGGVARVGEEGQEMLFPAPCGRVGAVDEQQGSRLGLARRYADEDFVMLETGRVHRVG